MERGKALLLFCVASFLALWLVVDEFNFREALREKDAGSGGFELKGVFDDEELTTHLHRYSRDPKLKAGVLILVCGLESSGTREVSKILAYVATGDACKYGIWSGTSYCGVYSGMARGYVLVFHRSIPHAKIFYNITDIYQQFKARNYEVFVVIATRDKSISLASKIGSHQRNVKVAQLEQEYGIQVINELKQSVPEAFIFNYETYMLLGRSYLEEMLRNINQTSTLMNWNWNKGDLLAKPLKHIKDGNTKYIIH